MDLNDLKALEVAATPAPWKPKDLQAGSNEDGDWAACGPFHALSEQGTDDEDKATSICEDKATADARLLRALRNLAPELLALWEAAENNATAGALRRLNEKATDLA